MIQAITEKAQSTIIDSQAPLVCWGDAVDTAVYLHQRTPNEGLTKTDDHNDYTAPYSTPYEMLHAFGNPSRNNDRNEISYKAPLHHLRQFGCYTCRLMPELQRHGQFSPRCTRGMMVGFMQHSTTLWKIWDPTFPVERSQSDVNFNKKRNAHASCLHGDQTDFFEQPEEMEYI
jgi:hypothetical protein